MATEPGRVLKPLNIADPMQNPQGLGKPEVPR